MSDLKSIPSVTVKYAQDGSSTKPNAMGMRAMQERVWLKRGEQYLLIKSPPASGKSRALMFVALDKLANQKLKQAIIVVPEKAIGRARMLYLSGISQGISTFACDATFAAIDAARRHGVKIAYDTNYRPRLWPPPLAAAPPACDRVARRPDLPRTPARRRRPPPRGSPRG